MENSSNTKTTDTSEIIQISDSSSLAELLELLEQVDLDSPLAMLNETTISDNNGGRIEL